MKKLITILAIATFLFSCNKASKEVVYKVECLSGEIDFIEISEYGKDAIIVNGTSHEWTASKDNSISVIISTVDPSEQYGNIQLYADGIFVSEAQGKYLFYTCK